MGFNRSVANLLRAVPHSEAITVRKRLFSLINNHLTLLGYYHKPRIKFMAGLSWSVDPGKGWKQLRLPDTAYALQNSGRNR